MNCICGPDKIWNCYPHTSVGKLFFIRNGERHLMNANCFNKLHVYYFKSNQGKYSWINNIKMNEDKVGRVWRVKLKFFFGKSDTKRSVYGLIIFYFSFNIFYKLNFKHFLSFKTMLYFFFFFFAECLNLVPAREKMSISSRKCFFSQDFSHSIAVLEGRGCLRCRGNGGG